MGKFIDFCIRYDPANETPKDLTKKIIYAVFVKRLKAKKPTVIFIGGDSGEGKSYSALRFQELILELQGINYKNHIDDINVFLPIEYPKKLDRLLFDESLKHVNVITMHEAREVVKAKKWQSFLNEAVSDVNAMSRTVKRLCFIIVSQFIRDISTNIRYTLNYYVTVTRPLTGKAKLSISLMWKDDRDLEKPKLRKRSLRGYLIYPDGARRLFIPQHLELDKPDKEVTEMFEKRDYESKAHVIRHKIEKLLEDMKMDLEMESKKVDTMVEWYMKNQEALTMIGKRRQNKWKLKPEVKVMHGLTDTEIIEFEKKLNKAMKDNKMIGRPVEDEDQLEE